MQPIILDLVATIKYLDCSSSIIPYTAFIPISYFLSLYSIILSLETFPEIKSITIFSYTSFYLNTYLLGYISRNLVSEKK